MYDWSLELLLCRDKRGQETRMEQLEVELYGGTLELAAPRAS
jgi:hypothetical protein